MTFLQPYILWGLPLLLLPLAIHLLNRMRYQSRHWAAMMFLLKATRSSTRLQKWRHLLILACRMLAVGAIVFALSRPLVTGWLGLAFSGPADTIIIVLDRSASMNEEDAETRETRRQRALALLSTNAKRLAEDSRLVLIESTRTEPHILPSADLLPELSETSPTDTAAHFPSLLQAAHDYIVSNQTGTTEIWIASDMQSSNWQPDSALWETLSGRIEALPQQVRIRLLDLAGERRENTGVRVREVRRTRGAAGWQLELLFEVTRTRPTETTIPVTLTVDGDEMPLQLDLKGHRFQVRHKLDLGEKATSGWGYVALPVDAQPADNRSYFVYGRAAHLRTVVVSDSAALGDLLALLSAPAPELLNQSAEVLSPGEFDRIKWPETAMVVWQAPLPTGDAEARLRTFVESGGTLVCFPTGEAAEHALFGQIGWGKADEAEADEPFTVAFVDTTEGPLARTASGVELPVDELLVLKRQQIKGGRGLAEFADGMPLLARLAVGKGHVAFWATLPEPKWSNLLNGTVLVPALQRLLQSGGRRLAAIDTGECGRWTRPGDYERLQSLSTGRARDYRIHAGVYADDKTLIALNRPQIEDLPERLDGDGLRRLFGVLPVQLLDEEDRGARKMQSELWRLFLSCALLFLVGEALLLSLDFGRRKRTTDRKNKTSDSNTETKK